MKKIVALNSTINSGGGKVMLEIAKISREEGYNYYTFSPRENIQAPQNHIYYSSKLEHSLNSRISQLTGYDNAFFKFGTYRFIKIIKDIKPDVIHLHGLHNWYIDYKILLKKLNKMKVKVVWTQHDCWSFTGKCPYYTLVNCDKWRIHCYNCPQLKEYPKSVLIDNSKWMYRYKKKYLTKYNNIILTTVSSWLNSEIKSSFLSNYKSVVIENGINMDIYKPSKSNIREKYDIKHKFIVLGVASGWSRRKGFNDFVELSKKIRKFNEFEIQIVLIGVSESQHIICTENGIIPITRTQDVNELVKWYSSADVLFNPSIEETFGLVTVEAMACGAPVIVYNSTASPELVRNTKNYCVESNNINDVMECIKEIHYNGKGFYMDDNIDKVKKNYSSKKQYLKYIDLYKSENRVNWLVE